MEYGLQDGEEMVNEGSNIEEIENMLRELSIIEEEDETEESTGTGNVEENGTDPGTQVGERNTEEIPKTENNKNSDREAMEKEDENCANEKEVEEKNEKIRKSRRIKAKKEIEIIDGGIGGETMILGKGKQRVKAGGKEYSFEMAVIESMKEVEGTGKNVIFVDVKGEAVMCQSCKMWAYIKGKGPSAKVCNEGEYICNKCTEWKEIREKLDNEKKEKEQGDKKWMKELRGMKNTIEGMEVEVQNEKKDKVDCMEKLKRCRKENQDLSKELGLLEAEQRKKNEEIRDIPVVEGSERETNKEYEDNFPKIGDHTYTKTKKKGKTINEVVIEQKRIERKLRMDKQESADESKKGKKEAMERIVEMIDISEQNKVEEVRVIMQKGEEREEDHSERAEKNNSKEGGEIGGNEANEGRNENIGPRGEGGSGRKSIIERIREFRSVNKENERDVEMLVIGDSIIRGMGKKICKKGAKVVSISGGSLSDVVYNALVESERLKKDGWLLVQGGGNSLRNDGRDRTTSIWEEFVEKIRELMPEVRIAIIPIMPRKGQGWKYNRERWAVNVALRRMVVRKNGNTIEMGEDERLWDTWLEDGVHLNEEGRNILAGEVNRWIGEMQKIHRTDGGRS